MLVLLWLGCAASAQAQSAVSATGPAAVSASGSASALPPAAASAASPGATATAPSSDSPPSAAVAAQPEPPALPAPAAGAASFVPAALCLLGSSEGLPPADAMTAAALVCEALREQGAHVEVQPLLDAPQSGAGSAYRIDLRPLGSIVLLHVAYESPIGVVHSARSLQLAHLEEVPVAAPRMAESLLTGKPLDQTAKINSLVGQETRQYQKQYGELKFGVGIFGFGVPSSDVLGGYGVHGQLYYETETYAVGGELRLGGSASGSGNASFDGVSLGARYFLNQHDITPFIGGGAGVLWLSYAEKAPLSAYSLGTSSYDGRYELSGSGLALHADFGVELLRLHDSRFDILLRADLPLFMVKGSDSTGSYSHYALPLSLMAAYSFP
jgi:hypothetical protein